MLVSNTNALLTVEEMVAADKATIDSGVEGFTLMRRAGEACAQALGKRFARQPVVVLVGPGNNGGDGFIIAEELRKAQWDVRVGLMGEKNALKGDAAKAAEAYKGSIHPLHPFLIDADARLIVDALFGTGLARPIEGEAAEVLEKIARRKLPVVAVDIPSGINGNTGEVMGAAAPAALTVTFHRKKRGHVLEPGRSYCGEIVVADIGILGKAKHGGKNCLENTPDLWRNALPLPHAGSHKYTRGHAVVQGGPLQQTGAARL
ncbi:MAG: NAD(P)H-hydrate epimerase, partial [Rickettsiales bacterium]